MLFTLYFLKDLLLLIMYASPLLAFFVSIVVFLGQRIGRREGWSRSDALYYSFITATTVGYGDFRPKSPRSKFQAVLIAFSGLIMTGIMVTLAVEAANNAFKDSGVYSEFRDHQAVIQETRQMRQPFSGLSVVGYLPDYRIAKWSPNRLGPVTDLIYFGAQLTSEGKWADPPLVENAKQKLQTARQAGGCRVLLCVGGGNRSQGFAAMATEQQSREQFIQSMLQYCLNSGFDGVDYDWEFPENEAEKKAYVDLIVETKQKLAPLGLLVTVALSPSQDLGQAAYRAVDRVHLMSYNHAYPQATLEKSTQDVERLIRRGCPAGKIALGVPFYGRSKQNQARTYADLVADHEPDSKLDSTHSTDEIDQFAFNGRATIQAKARYAKQQGLAGIMVWEIGQDTTDEKTSLLRAIGEAFVGD